MTPGKVHWYWHDNDIYGAMPAHHLRPLRERATPGDADSVEAFAMPRLKASPFGRMLDDHDDGQ